MADPTSARPVSGEIMTGRTVADAASPKGTDVVEAEFEVVPAGGSRPAAASGRQPPSAAPPVAPIAGLDMLRGPGQAAAVPQRGGPVFWIVGLGLVLAAFWVSGGHALIRQSALFQPDPPALSIGEVATRVETAGRRDVLLVDGTVSNPGGKSLPLPALEIRVSARDGTVTTYKLGTGGKHLAAGERFDFSSRLEVPKNGVRDVDVRFAE